MEDLEGTDPFENLGMKNQEYKKIKKIKVRHVFLGTLIKFEKLSTLK